jgi:hypothetical protein
MIGGTLFRHSMLNVGAATVEAVSHMTHIIMASSEKLGVASPYVVMPLDNASGIVLDRKIPPSIKKLMKNSGLDVYV